MANVCWFALFLVASALCTAIDTEAATFRMNDTLNSNPYMRIIHLPEHHQYVLVGSKNAMLNLSLNSMELTHTYPYPPNITQKARCRSPNKEVVCESYVRTLVPLNSTHNLVCASYARFGSCVMLSFSNHTQEWTLGNQTNALNVDAVSKAPGYPWIDNVYMVSGQHLYIATDVYSNIADRRPLMMREPLAAVVREDPVTRRTGFDPQFIRFDIQKRVFPTHIKLFETEESVFYLFTEPALEIYPSNVRLASRISRVCKQDSATNYNKTSLGKFFFATFFKSTLMCGQPPHRPSTDETLDKGRYGEYLEELSDASWPFESSTIQTDAGDKILIMAFNSARGSNSPASAICAYSMSTIGDVFDNSPNFDISNGGREFSLDENPIHLSIHANTMRNPGPAKCGRKEYNTTIKEMLNPFLIKRVEPINQSPLISLKNPGYRLTKLVVDRGIPDIDGKLHDVMFVGTDDGRVLKMADNGKGFNIIEERHVTEGKAIKDMRLIESDNGDRHILINSLFLIKRIGVEKCHRHNDCASCVASQDVYCAWSVNSSLCIRYQHEAPADTNDTRIQNLTSGDSPICRELYPTTTETHTTLKAVHSKSIVEVRESKQEDQPHLKMMIGLAVGFSIIFSLIGFVGGFFYARHKKSPTANLDNLSNRNKNGSSKLNDADIYQLPQQVKSNNITTSNNLMLNNGKFQIGEYEDTTLQSQKKSYV